MGSEAIPSKPRARRGAARTYLWVLAAGEGGDFRESPNDGLGSPARGSAGCFGPWAGFSDTVAAAASASLAWSVQTAHTDLRREEAPASSGQTGERSHRRRRPSSSAWELRLRLSYSGCLANEWRRAHDKARPAETAVGTPVGACVGIGWLHGTSGTGRLDEAVAKLAAESRK